jgi:hypothetical protein
MNPNSSLGAYSSEDSGIDEWGCLAIDLAIDLAIELKDTGLKFRQAARRYHQMRM